MSAKTFDYEDIGEPMSHTDPYTDTHTPVLIVGAGPAGMTEALALARLGVRSVLLTRYPSTAHTPRAHVVNQRTMEIFRDLGIEDRVREVAAPSSYMENNPWVTSLAGVEVARITAWGTGRELQRYTDASPSMICSCPQHLLEPILMSAVQETGLVDVRFGHEYIDHVQDGDGVTARVRVRDSTREYAVRSRYLVGADGARSIILEQLGIQPEGLSNVGQTVFAWIEADLGRYVDYRPGILYHPIVPDGRAGLIMVKPWNEWIAGFVPDETFDVEDHDTIIERVHRFIGDKSVPVRVKNVSMWGVNANSAPIYSRGRVFCMGDAVHRHLPWNGLGLNTGVADAYNLAWKLGLVLEGTASPALLETYNAERVPVGRQVIDRVNQTTMQMMQVPATIGNVPGLPPEDMVYNAEMLLTDSEGAVERRAALAEALDPLRTTGFNALGVEIGYRYREGATVSDGTAEPLPDGDPDYAYRATTWPGARLPHAWVEIGRTRISTLDLVGGKTFTLLTGRHSAPWHEAAETVGEVHGLTVNVVEIGGTHGVRDVGGDWARLREVSEEGAVLVRPDGHVAWRAKNASGATTLVDVISDLLGHSTKSQDSTKSQELADAP